MSLISLILPVIGTLIDKVLPDQGKAAEAKLELLRLAQEGSLKELDAAAEVIVAEAKSESWLTSSWRPITMLVFVVIIANNFILYPYLSLFFTQAPVLEVPDQMWSLLNIGIGGYIASRGLEKGIAMWKDK